MFKLICSLCGIHKVTVNPLLCVDQHSPLWVQVKFEFLYWWKTSNINWRLHRSLTIRKNTQLYIIFMISSLANLVKNYWENIFWYSKCRYYIQCHNNNDGLQGIMLKSVYPLHQTCPTPTAYDLLFSAKIDSDLNLFKSITDLLSFLALSKNLVQFDIILRIEKIS